MPTRIGISVKPLAIGVGEKLLPDCPVLQPNRADATDGVAGSAFLDDGVTDDTGPFVLAKIADR